MPPSTPPLQLPPKLYTANYHLHLQSPSSHPMKQGFPPLPARPEPETRARKQALLRPRHRTNPITWCAAILCVIFSVVIILAGVVTLIVFLVVKPRYPLFNTAAASLNGIVLDAPFYFNGDITLLANFTNPNHKLDVAYEYVSIELYFFDRLIAAQGLQAFSQRRGEARLQTIRMISSEVYLPPELLMEIQKQVRGNRVVYNIRTTLKVRASYGVAHYSYWLYGRCQIELTGPPAGVLVARSCRTKT